MDQHGQADWVGTEHATDAVDLAAHAASEGYAVVAAGGDGPVHEVVNGLMRACRVAHR
ncbi:MAG: hypothetical protein HYU88_12225 [Chloroflexi bacterium]|nr:hypothetical protein [Chloroflexota bacterium]